MSKATEMGTRISNGYMDDMATHIYNRDYRGLVAIGSLLVEIDRNMPTLERAAQSGGAAALRYAGLVDGVAKFEAKLSRRGLDPKALRALAIKHITPMASRA